MKPSAYSMGVCSRTEPLKIVVDQLNTLIADGTATRYEMIEKTIPWYMDWPLTNRWWPHTRNPNTAINKLDRATG